MSGPRSGEVDAGAMPARQPSLVHGAAWRLAAVMVRFGVSFVTVPLVTRALGMSQWGLLALFQTAAAPLLLVDLGFGAAGVKYVAEALGRGDREGAVKVVHTTLVFNAAAGLAGGLALALAAPWLARSVFAVPADSVTTAIAGLRISGVGLFLGIATAPYASTLAGHQRYDLHARTGAVTGLLTAATGVAVAWATRDVIWMTGAQTAAMAAVLLVYRRVANGVLPGAGALPRWDGVAARRSASFGRWHAAAVAGGMLAGWSDRYVLGSFFAPVVLGFYALPHTLYMQVYGTFGEMGEVLFPAVSHRAAAGDGPGARRLVLLAGWTLTSTFGICAAVLAAFGGDFLFLWISPEVAAQTAFTLRILCTAGIVGMAAVAPFHYVLGMGRPAWNALTALLVGATALGVSLVVVPRVGLPGVGFGLLAAVCVRVLVLALMWRRHFARDVSLASFALHVWVPALASLLLLAGLVWLHDTVAPAPSWPGLVLGVIVAVGVATAAQLLAAEVAPGGGARRREVIASIWPLVRAAMRLGR